MFAAESVTVPPPLEVGLTASAPRPLSVLLKVIAEDERLFADSPLAVRTTGASKIWSPVVALSAA